MATSTAPDRRRRRGRGVALAALLVALVLPGCLAQAGDVSKIVHVSSVNQQGWRYDFYRNTAYPCAVSGYQTFLIGTKIGSDPSATAPLWVKMHGGGVGFFDEAGIPQPASHKAEEGRGSLLGRIDSGLTADVMAAPEGFRVMAVSMCSHDLYAGTNTVDANNPNTLPDGTPVTTNGLLATKAAIAHAKALHPTDDVLLHGGSAGSAGTFHVSWSMQLQGQAPAGIVADAGIVNQAWEQAQIDQDLRCAMDPVAAQLVIDRWHPAVADPANQPDMLVADGRLQVPILHIWSSGDNNTCGATPMECPLRDGSVVTMGSADCVHEPMRNAIEELGPDARSQSLRLCVDNPNLPGACDKHVVTVNGEMVNTDPAHPADYNAVALAWVQARVADD